MVSSYFMGCHSRQKTATARLTLWEEHVGAVDESRSYTLKNLIVRVYQSTKYLTMGGEAAEIFRFDDIGTVAIQPDGNCEDNITLQSLVCPIWTHIRHVSSAKHVWNL